VATPELDPGEPLDPEADPELDPELLVLDPELLVLDADPELDPASALSPAAPPDPDEGEQAPTMKAIADQTVTWARTRMEKERTTGMDARRCLPTARSHVDRLLRAGPYATNATENSLKTACSMPRLSPPPAGAGRSNRRTPSVGRHR
jgi:hypothetical protein